MAASRFYMSSMENKKQRLYDIPIHDEKFSYNTTPVEEFLDARNIDSLMSLVLKYYLPIAELNRNVPSYGKEIVAKTEEFAQLKGLYTGAGSLVHSGSSSEELYIPPYRSRISKEECKEGDDPSDPYYSTDLDVMFLFSYLLYNIPSVSIDDAPSITRYEITKSSEPSVQKQERTRSFNESSSNQPAIKKEAEVEFFMDNKNCHPGFFKVIIKGEVSTLPVQFQNSIFIRDNSAYLSSDLLLNCLFETTRKDGDTFFETELLEFTRQGPALNMKKVNEESEVEGVTAVFDLDFVPSFKCSHLPEGLVAWRSRIRDKEWPPQCVQEELLQVPCYLVGIGHHDSEGKDLEWRLSTSSIEKVLASSLTTVQRKCYILFKILHRTTMKEPKVLATYHLKNILFETLEKSLESFWRETNIMSCLERLLDNLIHHLERGGLMSYFIPENNLIDHISQKYITEILEKAKDVRRFPVKYLIEFDEEFAFDFGTTKTFAEIFDPFLKLYNQHEYDFTLLSQSVMISLIRHAHCDINEASVVLYSRAAAILDEAWRISTNLDFGLSRNKWSFMSDVTYSGPEVIDSCRFQEYLRIKCPEAIYTKVDQLLAMQWISENFKVPGLNNHGEIKEANPMFKLLTYRMVILQSWSEMKDIPSDMDITGGQMLSGTEPKEVAITGAMRRAMLKIALWMGSIYNPAVDLSEEGVKINKARVAMEVLQEILMTSDEKESTGDTYEADKTTDTKTDIVKMVTDLHLSDNHSQPELLQQVSDAVPPTKDKDAMLAQTVAYELFIQWLNNSLDVNLYFTSACNMLIYFIQFSMGGEACRMLLRLNPAPIWGYSFLNFISSIDLKQLSCYAATSIFPEHLVCYLDLQLSCEIKMEFFQDFLLIECVVAHAGIFEDSEVEKSLLSAERSLNNTSVTITKIHCAFLLSVMNYRLKRYNKAAEILEAILKDAEAVSKVPIEEAISLYRALELSLQQ